MQPHQMRVVIEKQDLDDKIEKLSIFIKGPIYTSLAGAEQLRLNNQFAYMVAYSNCLGERIAAF